MRSGSVFIRADSSSLIGGGHVGRCLAIAEELRRRAIHPTFVCRSLPGNIIGVIEGLGYRVARLTSHVAFGGATIPPLAHWLGTTCDEDARQTIDVLHSMAAGPSLLVVDHYALDAQWESQVRPRVARLVAIDDLADRAHDVDALVDATRIGDSGDTVYATRLATSCKRMFGPKYALVRREFNVHRPNSPKPTGDVRSALIFYGNADFGRDCLKTLRAIALRPQLRMTFHLVTGTANADRDEISRLAAGLPHVRVYERVRDLAALMGEADVFVGGAGAVTWERFCAGLPGLAIATAENQCASIQRLTRIGAAYYLGRSSEVGVDDLARAFDWIFQRPEQLREQSERILALVDGRGPERVVAELLDNHHQ